ncbi:MAG: IS4 family transposase [Cryomorphaceae bacterium]|nr:IS4 family transposase [Flavobacteriales bacterium]
MSSSKLGIFSQVLQLIDRNTFSRLVKKHESDKHSKGINTWTHFVSMLFMQLASANSLRDITNGLRSATGNLNHFGVLRAPCKSSLSYLNKHRSSDIFQELYFELFDYFEPSLQKRKQYARRIKRKIFIMDSSVIPLSLSLFDWAKFRTRKGAVKLHAVLDYSTGLPAYAVLTDGKTHDVRAAKQTSFPAESVLVVDRAYVDYQWLADLDSSRVIFVTRLKSNADIAVVDKFLTNEKHEHILSDEDIELTGFYSSRKYPGRLRVVRVYDAENDQTLTLLTNQLSWTADTISQLYKARWAVEVFFKHLKQLFRVKTFVGTSANAVRIQMWCSMISMLLISHLKSKADFKWNLSNLITFLRINLFVKIDLWEWVNHPINETANAPPEQTLFT